MNEYCPDYWLVVKIDYENETIYKVFATWVGSFTQGDSWKLNSGITKVEREGEYLNFYGSSGSVYSCPNKKSLYRNSSYSFGVLENLIKRLNEGGGTATVMPFETDWFGLQYE